MIAIAAAGAMFIVIYATYMYICVQSNHHIYRIATLTYEQEVVATRPSATT